MAGLFTQKDNSPPPSPKARPMPASSFRGESALSGSPSRASSTARLAASPGPGTPTSRGQIPIAGHSNAQTDVDGDSPLAGASGTSVPGPGPSSLSQALRGSMGRSPPRFATASQADSFRGSSPGRRAPMGDSSQLAGSPRPTEDLEVLRRHLVGTQPGSQPSSYRTNNGFPKDQDTQPTGEEEDFSSLQLQGGDTTRHIYRYAEKLGLSATTNFHRARSTGHSSSTRGGPPLSALCEPCPYTRYRRHGRRTRADRSIMEQTYPRKRHLCDAMQEWRTGGRYL